MNAVFAIGIVFVLGYALIIFEHIVKVSKTAIALLIAVVCWAIYFLYTPHTLNADLGKLQHHVSDVSQIIFFLMGAMTIVELIDSHGGFKMINDLIRTSSKRKMLLLISFTSFWLSSVLDNLTTTILMVSILRKLLPDKEDRLLLGCLVVIAANAGGAWTPIGDVTTTMLWIGGQISTLEILKTLFVPSLVSLLVPLLYYFFKCKGRYEMSKRPPEIEEPGARLVFNLGIGTLIFVPIFKAITGLPPFMGVAFGLGLLWLVTDFLHHPHEHRHHLRVPHILTRIDTSGILFFLGILLSVDALQTAGILNDIASWLSREVKSLPLIATLIGFISALIDNVPLVAATMGMYSLENYPQDHPFWQMIAYAAGTGGSMLIIGSAAGVALMGMEKIDFFTYLKRVSLPAMLGFLAGMGAYLLLS